LVDTLFGGALLASAPPAALLEHAADVALLGERDGLSASRVVRDGFALAALGALTVALESLSAIGGGQP
jgi:hypothetical protein